ncbi:sensor histidine kinase [Winogradskyella jejuensis]|uniref:histidine kinase n=1 Tax=Winogradskyella jejuensis TaxID=1089305 RepID=A0A1M5U2K8_9FLAO|nr:GAF domain-containing sensor histidine kinase [Winogradskyella jejuensis]SHH57262.1 GAF sensor signal transduction histidine kinase [Winogradskyella jejuensis]
MISPEFPINESERLNAVKSYSLLDTLPETDFDDITALISAICEVPISLITLLDTERNFLKSHHGVELSESPRSISFCGHAILSDDEIYIIEDARKSKIFHDNPLVTEFKAIFYAGVPLRNPEGFPLGTLCVYDHKPRQLSENQIRTLKIIAKQVMNLFELRKTNLQLDSAITSLETQNAFLEKFSGQVSHDLKSPLANISSLTEFIKEENGERLSQESLEYLDLINESSESLRNYIDGALHHYRADASVRNAKEDFSLESVFNEISKIQNLRHKNFVLKNDVELKNANKSALTQILFNLVDNAYKYNNNTNPKVELDFEDSDSHYYFLVIDNGMGIEKKDLDKIFELFNISNPKDVFGKKGSGIGLFTVKSMIEKLGGTISVTSKPHFGTTFRFSIKK